MASISQYSLERRVGIDVHMLRSLHDHISTLIGCKASGERRTIGTCEISSRSRFVYRLERRCTRMSTDHSRSDVQTHVCLAVRPSFWTLTMC